MSAFLTEEDLQLLPDDEMIAALDEKSIFFDEVYIRIFDFESQIEKTKYIAHLRQRAKELKIHPKDFENMLRYWQAKYINDTKDGIYNNTAFTDCPLTALRCGAWEADDKGVRKENLGTACTHPIVPVERLYNLDT